MSPTTLGRSAWAENALQTATRFGVTQYLIVAAGYDTLAYRQPSWATDLRIFELDHPLMSEDKQNRVRCINDRMPYNLIYIPVDLSVDCLSDKLCSCKAFTKSELSFVSLLGITYYLSKADYKTLLWGIADSVPKGSTLVFDYPIENIYTKQAGERPKKQSMLASGANEEMLASYSYGEINRLLSDCGFLIYEHLTPDEITEQYFSDYNTANPDHIMTALENVNFCLAVRQ